MNGLSLNSCLASGVSPQRLVPSGDNALTMRRTRNHVQSNLNISLCSQVIEISSEVCYGQRRAGPNFYMRELWSLLEHAP
jgi:hypothetical protein